MIAPFLPRQGRGAKRGGDRKSPTVYSIFFVQELRGENRRNVTVPRRRLLRHERNFKSIVSLYIHNKSLQKLE